MFPDPFASQMFLLPSLITMSIAATWMHRSLIGFATSTIEMYDDFSLPLFLCSLPMRISNNNDRHVSELQRDQFPGNRTQFTADSLYERHQMSRTSCYDAYISTEDSHATSLMNLSLDKESPFEDRVREWEPQLEQTYTTCPRHFMQATMFLGVKL
jgi:hypothetical protein